MRFLNSCVLLFLLFISPFSSAANRLFHYAPELVELTGIVNIMTFPGAPNYESIKEGDSPETSAYLKLDRPIDVDLMPNAKDDINEPEKNINLVQLVIQNDKDWKKIKNGQRLHVIGTLFHGVTAHHHTKILIDTKKIS